MKSLYLAITILSVALMAGCGSSSDSDDTGSIAFTEYDLANYQPVSDSGDLRGIWVGVLNYSGTDSADDIDFTFNASQKMVFSIFRGDEGSLYVTGCDGASEELNFNEEFDFLEEQAFIQENALIDIIDNNIMVLRDQESETIWYALKINHSAASLGSVKTEGSGSQSGEYSQLAVGFCQQSIEAKTTSGYTVIATSTKVSMADNLELSIDPNNISELDFTRKDFKGSNVDGNYDIELSYKRLSNDSEVSLNFSQENIQGSNSEQSDNIEYIIFENSSHVYAGDFLVTSVTGEQAAAFKFNFSY